MRIGLTGQNGAGKGEVADILRKQFNFTCCSLSDALREEASRQAVDITRENLQLLGNRLRQQEGTDILAVKVLEKITPDSDYVIDSIRNPHEAETLRRHGVLLWSVRAPQEVRFQRLIRRAREAEPLSFEAFRAAEARENQTRGDHGLMIGEVEKRAAAVIVNDCTLADLEAQVRLALTAALAALGQHP